MSGMRQILSSNHTLLGIALYKFADGKTLNLMIGRATSAANIKPVSKTLRFDSTDFKEMVGKTEGMALLGNGSLALINYDDFGITGGARRSSSSAALVSRVADPSTSVELALCRQPLWWLRNRHA